MQYKNSIVLTCPESWMCFKIAKYIEGGSCRKNINRWCNHFNDVGLDIIFEKMDSFTMFITINTSNLFITTTFLNAVINKLHEGIILMQNIFFEQDVKINTMYRYDGERFEDEFMNGKCINANTYTNYIHVHDNTPINFQNITTIVNWADEV